MSVVWRRLLLTSASCVSEKAVFRPSDEAVFTTLGVNTHLFTCEPSELDSLVRTRPSPENGSRVSPPGGHSLVLTACVCFPHPQLPLPEEIHWTPGDSKLHDMSAEEVANQLVVFDWELFSCVHEVGDITAFGGRVLMLARLAGRGSRM